MLRWISALCVLALVLGGTAAEAAGKPKPLGAKPAAGHDPQVEAQLRAAFGRLDANKDGFLDDQELAVAFRGPKAKAAPAPLYDDKGNFLPRAGRAPPDQVYLLALDKDGDGRVSWAEFEAYGEAYAAQFKNAQRLNQQALRTAYLQAQRNFAAAQRRNATYSRSRYKNNAYYRPVRRHSANGINQASWFQDQYRRLLQDQQRRLLAQQRLFMQYQQSRLQAQRQRAVYSRQVPPVHRPVMTHGNRKHR